MADANEASSVPLENEEAAAVGDDDEMAGVEQVDVMVPTGGAPGGGRGDGNRFFPRPNGEKGRDGEEGDYEFKIGFDERGGRSVMDIEVSVSVWRGCEEGEREKLTVSARSLRSFVCSFDLTGMCSGYTGHQQALHSRETYYCCVSTRISLEKWTERNDHADHVASSFPFRFVTATSLSSLGTRPSSFETPPTLDPSIRKVEWLLTRLPTSV